jgi:hypothetical protein
VVQSVNFLRGLSQGFVMLSGWMKSGVLGAVLALGIAGAANAGPTYIFNYSVNSTAAGAADTNIGTITLSQIDATTVQIALDLASGWGLINSGSKTPFAFNLSDGFESGLTISAWLTPGPLSGNPSVGDAPNGDFSLSTGGVDAANPDFPNSPFPDFRAGIEYSGGNGSSNGWFGTGGSGGDLIFQLKRVGGLSTDNFIKSGEYYFSADVSNGSNTGAQAWAKRETVPEPMTLTLFGAGVAGAAYMRRRRNKKA